MEQKQNNQSKAPSKTLTSQSDFKRPDKVHPYRLSFWSDVIGEDSSSEAMNFVGMLLSMIGMLLKYKTLAWLAILMAAASYANARANHDGQQILSTFMLALSALVLCYLSNPQPIAFSFSQQQMAADAPH